MIKFENMSKTKPSFAQGYGRARETIIISLGGSLVAPGEVDLEFLKKFKNSLEKYIGKNRFFIMVGGGKPARIYQKALLEFGAKEADRDWMGINITRLNAEIIKQMFYKNSYQRIITDPNEKFYLDKSVKGDKKSAGIKTSKNVIVGAGWKPGWSTDYDAVLIAKNNNAKTIINLTNIDYVYDKNPKDFPDAKPFKEINWKDFEKIVGDKWSPGLSMPFDPRASKLAAKLGMQVIMINGGHPERLENFLDNKPFIGTTIK
jgi:uridylate kinase